MYEPGFGGSDATKTNLQLKIVLTKGMSYSQGSQFSSNVQASYKELERK